MKKNMLKNWLPVLIVAALASCQMPSKDGQSNMPATEDTTSEAHVTNPHMKPAETGYAEVNGLKMYYEVYGQGKPLVLLHGSLVNIPMNWSKWIPALAKDRKVVVAEMQGHGRTRDITRAFSYEAMADDVSGLLTHLKIDSADILGYSMGGGIAFQFAVRHPQQLRRLIILSGTYAHDGWWPDVEASFKDISADMFKGSPIEQQYDSLGNDPAHFPEFVKKVMSIDLKTYNWTKEVKSIQAPLFVVIGDADGVKYEHAIELFKAKGGGKMGDIHGLPQSRLAILPGSTHIGIAARTAWLIPMITEFLDSDLKTTPHTF